VRGLAPQIQRAIPPIDAVCIVGASHRRLYAALVWLVPRGYFITDERAFQFSRRRWDGWAIHRSRHQPAMPCRPGQSLARRYWTSNHKATSTTTAAMAMAQVYLRA